MDEPRPKVQRALQELCEEDELVLSWLVVMEVAGQGDVRYLEHISGGGIEGTDPPVVWQIVGMLEAALQGARDQLYDCTADVDDD